MICYHCQKAIPELKKIGFREECPHCEHDLHTCKGCKHFAPGKPNQCNVPNTDFIRDRDTRNFCEEFEPLQKKMEAPEKEDTLKKFNSLFKD